MFILDTDVLSASRRPKHTPPQFAAWIESIPAEHLFLSAITVLEIRTGVLRLVRRDPVQADRLQRWLEARVIAEFHGRILPFDIVTAMQCAPLHVPDPRPERDAMIAATALQHGLTVVTRNIGDFAPMRVPVLNPWTAQA